MSVDRLQEKIRKTKTPVLLDFDIAPDQLPPHLLAQERTFEKAYTRFCMELMDGLRGVIPAVKWNFSAFALLGAEGLLALEQLLSYGKKLGYYVILELPEALSAQRAGCNAALIADGQRWDCDGVVISAYIGSDAIRPYGEMLTQAGKALFVVVRTGNRSAMELQDLLTGGRNVFDAAADLVNRFATQTSGKSGYRPVALVGPGSSASILRRLRQKYPQLFIMIDGFDYPNANAKNCAEAVDRVGHGAIACAGTSITAAWKAAENDGAQYVDDAMEAAQRAKKNLSRYFTVL